MAAHENIVLSLISNVHNVKAWWVTVAISLSFSLVKITDYHLKHVLSLPHLHSRFRLKIERKLEKDFSIFLFAVTKQSRRRWALEKVNSPCIELRVVKSPEVSIRWEQKSKQDFKSRSPRSNYHLIIMKWNLSFLSDSRFGIVSLVSRKKQEVRRAGNEKDLQATTNGAGFHRRRKNSKYFFKIPCRKIFSSE